MNPSTIQFKNSDSIDPRRINNFIRPSSPPPLSPFRSLLFSLMAGHVAVRIAALVAVLIFFSGLAEASVSSSRQRHTGTLSALLSLHLAEPSTLAYPVSSSPRLTATINVTSFLGVSWASVTVRAGAGVVPKADDWVGFFLVNAPPPSHAPIKFLAGNGMPGYLSTGVSTFLVQLIPMRDDVVLYTFSNGSAPIFESKGCSGSSFRFLINLFSLPEHIRSCFYS